MRKTLIDGNEPTAKQAPGRGKDFWLNLDEIATVEITSEERLFPIEQALAGTPNAGWRAAAKGPQRISLNFDEPIAIRRIALHFVDLAAERSQEFAIYVRNEQGDLREVIRQQFSFNPGGSSEEIEDYAVDLHAVTSLELRIDPDRAHDPAHSQHYAVLKSLRLA